MINKISDKPEAVNLDNLLDKSVDFLIFLAGVIKDFREEKQMSQEEFAEKCGISVKKVERLINVDLKMPNYINESVADMSKSLNSKQDEILLEGVRSNKKYLLMYYKHDIDIKRYIASIELDYYLIDDKSLIGDDVDDINNIVVDLEEIRQKLIKNNIDYMNIEVDELINIIFELYDYRLEWWVMNMFANFFSFIIGIFLYGFIGLAILYVVVIAGGLVLAFIGTGQFILAALVILGIYLFVKLGDKYGY